VSQRHLAAVPEQPRRVALYVRVSALMGRGGDDFHSPDVQTNAMRRLTAGLQEVDVIEDIDQTGRTFSRDGIDKIRKLAEAHAIDAVAVYNVSRLGRNVLESLKFLTWLAERGVTILSATEHIDTGTPSGRWMLTNMLAIAEMRSDEISGEWARTIHHRAAAGKPHGKPATGYVRGPDGRFAVDPFTGPAIRAAFIDYAAGAGARQIRLSVRAATGLEIDPSTLKRILRNRTYLGIARVRGQLGLVEVPGAHEPLVDEVTWQRVQARVAADRKIAPALKAAKYPLSGLCQCAACGLGCAHRKGRTKGGVAIACARQYQSLEHCTGCGMMSAADVEAYVLHRVAAYVAELKTDSTVQAAVEARTRRAGINAKAVQGELSATRKAMSRSTERWARGQLDDRTYDDTMTSLRQTEADLAVSLASLEQAAERPPPKKVAMLGERLLKLYPRMNAEQRNRALKDLVEKIVLRPAARYREPAHLRAEIHWL
jgi:site-specific DNA recombinase